MPTTPNLGITHLVSQQFQPDVVVNAALDTLDAAFTGLLLKTITAADVTIDDDEFIQHYYHRLSGVLTADHNYIVPAIQRPFTVEHGGSAHDVTVKTAGGSGIAIVPGGVQRLYCDGTDVVPDGPATSATGSPFILGGFHEGRPGANGLVLATDILIPLLLPTSLTGSRAKARTATTATKVFDIRQNGVSIGSYTISAGQNLATFTFASPITLAVNDDFMVVAPASQDATLADLTTTFLAYRA